MKEQVSARWVTNSLGTLVTLYHLFEVKKKNDFFTSEKKKKNTHNAIFSWGPKIFCDKKIHTVILFLTAISMHFIFNNVG